MDGMIMDDALFAEKTAADAISVVRDFIECLRAEFRPQKLLHGKQCLKDVPIYTGINARGLPQKLRSIRFPNGSYEETTRSSPSSFEGQRRRILSEFALPLAELLAQSYKVLDELPESNLANKHEDSKNASSNTQRPRRAKNRPAPPRGMLSIQDYTDVACLLEFIVCTGILPIYEAEMDALNSNTGLIEDRLRTKLPKSLAGRIPGDALRWGTSSSSSSSQDHNEHHESLSLLVQTVEAITRVVVLDRFRPMLLPRHLIDIYGACFKIEYHVESGIYDEINMVTSDFYHVLGLSFPKFLVHRSPTETSTVIKSTVIVDPTLRAMAFQTLLSSSAQPQDSTVGKKSKQQRFRYNSWLQSRVSRLLTDLATKDLRGLSAILTVFVPVLSSSTDQASLMTGASQRLGRTLAAMTSGKVTMDNKEQNLQGRLCQQFLRLLSVSIPAGSGKDANSNIAIPPRSMAVIQTAWAFFEHLSQATIDTYVFGHWAKCMSSKDSEPRIYETIRQVHALCAFIPPHSASALKFLRKAVAFGNDSFKDSTLLAQFLRVAMIENAEGTNKSKPRIALDAHQTLLSLTQVIYVGSNGNESGSIKSDEEESPRDQLVSNWISALGSTGWDLAGYSFVTKKSPKKNDNPVETVAVQSHRPLITPTPMEEFIESVQSTTARAEFFVQEIVLMLAPPSRVYPSNQDDTPEMIQGLTCRIFRLLLQQYLSGEKRGMDNGNSKLIATVLLPILCERCSQEQLLFGSHQDNASGLLLLIRQVLSELADARSSSKMDYDNGGDHDDDHRHEFLKSIAGILTSLLIALMEVGSKSRSQEEEDLLQSFLPVLQSLSIDTTDIYHSNVQDGRKDDAAMADMAAYAMALIASRRSVTTKNSDPKASKVFLSPEDRLKSILEDAENDLGSTQAPIRAKGIVSLGRLARGFTDSLRKEQKAPSLIQELDDTGQILESGDKTLVDWIEKVLELSVNALNDKESYVFLAAIQTIVAVGDLHPEKVLPTIASAIVTGQLDSSTNALVPLSQEQVIKLAEALMFTIRRRAVTDDYVPILINLILRGGTRDKEIAKIEGNSRGLLQKDQIRIQQETAEYFATGKHQNEEIIEEDSEQEKVVTRKEQWKEQDIRLKTGGPIFDFEEADVVRSLRISIVSELVASAAPQILAPYVTLVAKLATEAMHLEKNSRIIQRTAALLVRELYARVLGEATDLTDALEEIEDSSLRATIPISTALVESDEEALLATLHNFGSGRSSTDATFVPDSTVIARCKEAIDLRNQAESAGVFVASRLMLEERNQLEALPALLRGIASAQNDGETQNAIAINPVQTLR